MTKKKTTILSLLNVPFNRDLELPSEVTDIASKHDFEVKAFQMDAGKEQLRPPRTVRIGLIQNKIVLPTSAPVQEQVEYCLCYSTCNSAQSGNRYN